MTRQELNYQVTAMSIIRKSKMFGLVTTQQIDAVASYVKENNKNGNIQITKQKLQEIMDKK